MMENTKPLIDSAWTRTEAVASADRPQGLRERERLMAEFYEFAIRDETGHATVHRTQSLAELAKFWLHYEEAHPDHDRSACAVEDGERRELTRLEKAAMGSEFDQHDAARNRAERERGGS